MVYFVVTVIKKYIHFVFLKMVVNEVDFKRALKSVFDSLKIPWLYRIEALFKGMDVFASLPTGLALIFRAAQIVADELLFSSICPYLKSSRATRFVDCS